MFDKIKKELFYQYRCSRLTWSFLRHKTFQVNLQVTWNCNFKCEVCDFWKPEWRREHAGRELTLEEIETIGRKLGKLGTHIISLSGGEPLIRKDLYDIISILNRTGHFPILITNGWFVDEDVAKTIHKAGLQEISVSLDYIDPANHDRQRGQAGAWDRAVKALELLNKHRPDPRNRVHMISILMDDNLDDIEPLIKLAKELGVTYMVNLYSCCRGTKAQRIPDRSVTEYLLALKKQYPEFVTLTSYIEKFDQAIMEGGIGNCRSGELFFNIDNRGEVSRCIDTVEQSGGNIFKEELPVILENLKDMNRKNPCSDCWTSCRGFSECMYVKPRMRQFKEFYNSVRKHNGE